LSKRQEWHIDGNTYGVEDPLHTPLHSGPHAPRATYRLARDDDRPHTGLMPLPGRVVILNGTSSAGKSTIVDMFREQRAACGEWWVPVAIDEFQVKILPRWLEGLSHRGPFSRKGIQFKPGPGRTCEVSGEVRGYR
jgi:hypothetical protein